MRTLDDPTQFGCIGQPSLSESLEQAMGNVVRTLEVAESGRLFQKLNICCLRDTCRSSSSPVTQAISLSSLPLCSDPYPVPSRNSAANIYCLAGGFAMRHWSFLLHRRKIGSGRIKSNTIYCREMPCEKLDQN